MTRQQARIAILGLGEAGRAFAEDLGARALVRGFDPVATGEAKGYERVDSAANAVSGAEAILVFTAAPDAVAALESVLDAAPSGALYADLSSSSPALKARLAALAAAKGLRFVDAALIDPVLRARSATPILAAGAGAAAFGVLMEPLGLVVTVLGDKAGDAAARKMLRSIVIKGLTTLMIEALRAAEDQDMLEWYSEHLVEFLGQLNQDRLSKLLSGTLLHSERRIHEMTAAIEMIEDEGGDASMTKATVAVLRSIPATPIPRGSALR